MGGISKENTRYPLSVVTSVYDKVEELAKIDNRSVNNYIINIILYYLNNPLEIDKLDFELPVGDEKKYPLTIRREIYTELGKIKDKYKISINKLVNIFIVNYLKLKGFL